MVRDRFYNTDCITGCKKNIADNSVDLIITDPPYGISGDKLHKHYNRNEKYVIEGYIEVPEEEYEEFSLNWIKQAERILKPGGSIYIVSGYSNLFYILKALRQTKLRELNHIIWKYNFGVYTRRKYVSSHYHILYYTKPGGKHVFNTHCRYGATEKDLENGSLNYQDREDVWIINREYKHGRTKNKNELPRDLLTKMIQYSSNPGDLVCDLFLGSFSTAKVAIGLARYATGFELSKKAFDHQIREMDKIVSGSLLEQIKKPDGSTLRNQGKPWTEEERNNLFLRYNELFAELGTKKGTIAKLTKEFGRGRFSILNVLKKNGL